VRANDEDPILQDDQLSPTEEEFRKPTDDLSRREWLLRLGEMVVLAGVSGLVPESAAALLSAQAATEQVTTALPPGLYDASPDHLVHALSSAGKKWSPPPGSETDYVQPSLLPLRPQFLSPDEFREVTRFIEILLGNVDSAASAQAAQWFDAWLHSSAGVRSAARNLDPMHRLLAVAVNGESSVRELETADPQAIARAGLAALRVLSLQAHGQEFLQLTNQQQFDLLTSVGAAQPDNPLRKFFELARSEAIRGYYTSSAGLQELDYKGNAYYAGSPGCETKS
jgi:hypothetical protein